MPQTREYVKIFAPTAAARRRWAMVLELAEMLGPERSWSLIGGLMVQLHGFERGSVARPTADIDLLGDSRRRPAVTEQIAAALVRRGGEMSMPPVSNDKLGFRFELDGETVEVLGPDGLREAPKTLGRHITFEVPGGTQALLRTGIVLVSLDGKPPVAVRRPSLLGAILIKSRVVAKRRERKHAADRQDVVRLLGLVDDPREVAICEGLRRTEQRWLRDIESLLDFEDVALTSLFQPREIARAKQTYRLLTR